MKNGQAGRGPDVVQKVFWMCEAKNGTETDELLQARAGGHQRVWQNVKADSGPQRMVGSRQRSQENGGLKDKREESQEKNIRGF